jgi:hypothetical protein
MRSTLFVLFVGSVVHAQAPVVVPDAPSCAGCSIGVSRKPLDAKPSGLTSAPTLVQSDGRGRIWVFSSKLPPLVFDSTGKFLRPIGPTGSGPGEFLPGGTLARLAGDSIALFDVRNGRAFVVSSDLRLGRQMPLTMSFGRALGIGGRRLLITGFVRKPDAAGLPLHFVDLDTGGQKVIQSFGPKSATATSDLNAQLGLSWLTTTSGSGGFWTEELLAYRVRRWSRDGQLEIDLERRPEWFVPQAVLSAGDATHPPSPFPVGLSEQGELVWTFTNVADANWRKAWPPEAATQREVLGSRIDYTQLFDTMVEVIDTKTRRVVARTRLPEYAISVLPGARLAVYREDADGFPLIEILQMSVKR